MVTRVWTSRVLQRKGKQSSPSFFSFDYQLTVSHSFGWVNASYVYGMTMTTTGMRRALGTITPYDTYKRMTEHGIEFE